MKNIIIRDFSTVVFHAPNGEIVASANYAFKQNKGRIFEHQKENLFDQKLDGAVVCEITNLFVHPTYRRKYYGKQILNHIYKKAFLRTKNSLGNCNYLFVNVLKENKEAIEFYKSFGFEFCKNYHSETKYSTNMIKEVI